MCPRRWFRHWMNWLQAYQAAKADTAFWDEFASLSRDFSGRPTPLYLAERLTADCGGARIFLKREDLAHTGAHKINNALGRDCWPSGWASAASSPRRAPASTA